MPTEAITHCFSTRDAVERSEGSFTFEFPGVRNGAQKVMLGSLEFPIVQWTIEKEWGRLYMTEALRIAPGGQELVFRNDGELRIVLPLTINPCRLSRAVPSCDVAVVCGHPHGLFVENELVVGGPCTLMATPVGDIDLARHKLLPVNETTFVIQGIKDAAGLTHAVENGILHCPWTDSPHDVCKTLNEIAGKSAYVRIGAEMRFQYDDARDAIRLRVFPRVQGIDSTLTLEDTPLSRVLGLAPVGWRLGESEAWPTEGTRLWDYCELEPGFYTPAHRPMSVGPPGRITDAIELSANRFYFPLLAGEGVERYHMLIFGDATGSVYRTRVLPGNYTPEALAVHLQRGMLGASAGRKMIFEVRYDEPCFVFACAREHRGSIEPVPFTLYFNHPQSIEPARLGFPSAQLSGESSYVGRAVRSPRRPVSGDWKALADARDAPLSARSAHMQNLLRVQDISGQKRFRFSATTTSNLVARIAAFKDGVVTTVVYVNREPFSHGLVIGDVVALAPYSEPPRPAGASGDAPPPLATTTDGELPALCSAVVVDTNGVAELSLAVPSLACFKTVGTGLTVIPAVLPWGLRFTGHHSVPASLLGFEAKAYCWGADGELMPRRLPPYLAPHVHSLDHPDYVLITLSAAGTGALEHTQGNNTRQVFCKLTLYPLFREERMLPRDAPCLGPKMGRFTLNFHNPDWSKYHFHGAHFSFSLNFVTQTPE